MNEKCYKCSILQKFILKSNLVIYIDFNCVMPLKRSLNDFSQNTVIILSDHVKELLVQYLINIALLHIRYAIHNMPITFLRIS